MVHMNGFNEDASMVFVIVGFIFNFCFHGWYPYRFLLCRISFFCFCFWGNTCIMFCFAGPIFYFCFYGQYPSCVLFCRVCFPILCLRAIYVSCFVLQGPISFFIFMGGVGIVFSFSGFDFPFLSELWCNVLGKDAINIKKLRFRHFWWKISWFASK